MLEYKKFCFERKKMKHFVYVCVMSSSQFYHYFSVLVVGQCVLDFSMWVCFVNGCTSYHVWYYYKINGRTNEIHAF